MELQHTFAFTVWREITARQDFSREDFFLNDEKNRANQRNQYSSLSLLLAMLYEMNSEINCSCVDGLLSSSKHASQFRKKCACSLSWFGARYFIVRLSRNEKEGGRKNGQNEKEHLVGRRFIMSFIARLADSFLLMMPPIISYIFSPNSWTRTLSYFDTP